MDNSNAARMETPMRYRAFISYRRCDAKGLARWLRRRLIEFSVPPNLLAKLEPGHREQIESRPGYFLDTSYELANEDWWRDNILPALRQSDYLIVLSSPSLIEPRPDGNQHVVDKEVEAWRDIHGDAEARRRIIPIVSGSIGADALPASLMVLGTSWHIVDFRVFSAWRWFRLGAAEQLDNGVLAIMSSILKLPQALIPELRNEDAKLRGRRRRLLTGMAFAVIVGLGGSLLWALAERDRAEASTALAEVMRGKAEHERDRALLQEARAVSKRAVELIRAGDAQSGMLAALAVLPTPEHPRPYSPEAVMTLYEGWLSNREVATLNRHQGRVLDVAYAPDSKSIVTASEDRTALVWDMSGNKPESKASLQHDGPVFKASFSPDGRQILTLSRDGAARVWVVDGNLKKPLVLEIKEVIRPIWENDREQRIPIREAAFSRNGDLVVTCAEDGQVHIWDITGAQPTSRLVRKKDEGVESSEGFSVRADGQMLAVGTSEGVVELWNLRANPPTKEDLSGHRAMVSRLSFSSDGTRLVTTSHDGEVRMWDMTVEHPNSKLLRRADVDSIVIHTEFSDDGLKVLVVSSSEGRLLDIADPKKSTRLPLFEAVGAKIGPGGQEFVVIHRNGEVGLVELVGGALKGFLLGSHDRPVAAAAYNPKGTRVVTVSSDHSGRVWDASDSRPLARRVETASPLESQRFSPDGSRIVGLSDGRALIWKTDDISSAPVRFGDRSWPVKDAAFSFDGKRIVAMSDDGRVRIWDIDHETGTPTDLEMSRRGWLSELPFSLDGPRVVVDSSRAGIKIWSLAHEPPLSTLVPVSRSHRVLQVHDKGGGSIVTGPGDGVAQFWDLSREWPSTGTWSNAIPLAGHRGEVSAAALSQDRRRLATASKEGGIWIWDLNTNPPAPVALADDSGKAHSAEVHTAAFSADGRFLVTASLDGTAKVWSVTSKQPSAIVFEIDIQPNGAELTPDGSHLLTTEIDRDGTKIKIWAVNAEPPWGLELGRGSVRSIAALSRDGRHVAASDERGDLVVWPMFGGVQEFIGEVRKGLTRCLTNAERYKLGLPKARETPSQGREVHEPSCD